jgi:hypothetical protein
VNSNQLRQDLKVTEEKLKRDLRGTSLLFKILFAILYILIELNGSATSNDLETAKTNLASTRTELNSTKSAVSDLATELKGKIN